jgi:lysophospholipase L1-like esterase
MAFYLRFFTFNLILLSFNFPCFSQASIFNLPEYPFIKYDLDRIIFSQDSSSYDGLYAKMSTLVSKGQGQINIVHIGDSHIQADYFSGRMRERLQTFFLGGKGSRGFIFPFKLIRSNNAFNFAVNSTGAWTGCRNIERNKSCTLGLAGASATTTDSISSFSIRLRKQDYPSYDFNRVKVFHNMDSTSFDIETENYILKQEFVDSDSLGYTLFVMKNYYDSLTFYITKTDTIQKSFTLFGINLENEDPGIIYHSIGVNGAEVESFLRCSILSYQLAKLKPDWVIVSLGTNDCYSTKCNMPALERNLLELIKLIRIAQPDVPILFTTPADNYRKRRYHNPDCAVASDVIIKVAKENNCASWNLYEIMGGYGSMGSWLKSGLAARDKLHFDKPGYYLQGDLLFNAFIKAYDNYIDKNTVF